MTYSVGCDIVCFNMERKSELGVSPEKPVHLRGRGRLWSATLLSGLLAMSCLVPGNTTVPEQPSEPPTPDYNEIISETWAMFGGLDGLLITASCVQPHVTEQGIQLGRHLDVRVNYEALRESEDQLWLSVRNEETTQGVVAITATDPKHLAYEFHGQVSNIRPAGPMDAIMSLQHGSFYTFSVYEYPFTQGVPDLTSGNRLAQISFAMNCVLD